jgi:hypothetical protein
VGGGRTVMSCKNQPRDVYHSFFHLFNNSKQISTTERVFSLFKTFLQSILVVNPYLQKNDDLRVNVSLLWPHLQPMVAS